MTETFYFDKDIMADFAKMSKADFLAKYKYRVCEEDYDETARMDKDIRSARTMENAIELAKMFTELDMGNLLDLDDYSSAETNTYIASLAKEFEDEFDDEYLVDHPYSELIYEWGRKKLLEAYGKKEWLVKITYTWTDNSCNFTTSCGDGEYHFCTREEAWQFAFDKFKTRVNTKLNPYSDNFSMRCKIDKEKGEIVLMYPDRGQDTKCEYIVCQE